MKWIYLSKSEIIASNKALIDEFGGNYVSPYNFLNESSLDYLIEMVEHGVLFGEPMYPNIESKAALYMYNICQNHIFTDGNKRTGLDIMLTFLNLNGYDLKNKLEILVSETEKFIPSIPQESRNSDAILEKFVIEVASGQISHEEIIAWLVLNIEKI